MSETRDVEASATPGVVQGTHCRASHRGSITGDARMEGFRGDAVGSTRVNIPSRNVAIENGHSWIFPLKIVMFHSDVKSPRGYLTMNDEIFEVNNVKQQA